jgi:zinc transport system substrate-binding protein
LASAQTASNKQMKKYVLLALLFSILGGGFYAMNRIPAMQKARGATLEVTTSFYPLYFLASQIGRDKATVYNITPAGSEPHDYEPTTQDIVRIEKGDILILNGGVETWGNKMRDNLKGTDVTIVTAGDGLFTQNLTEDGQTGIDPHIWLDPMRAKAEAAKITQAFVAKDPGNRAYYQTNEKILDGKLATLDRAYQIGLASCQSKNIVTAHAAFGYLAARYGLHQEAIAGLSPDAEPSAKQLVAITTYAKIHNVHYIFFESLASPKLSQTLASEIGAKTLVLDPLEGIPEDEMRQGKNYFTIMQDNLLNLQTALQCEK